MKILIVDEHILFREGLVSMLSTEPEMTVIGDVGTVGTAIEKTIEFNPDIVLMDIYFPDGNGLEAIRTILLHSPKTKIVILTIYEDDNLFFTAIRNGAVGYLLKNIPLSKLLKSIRALECDQIALSRKMSKSLLIEYQRVGRVRDPEKVNLNSLTSREMEVLNLLGIGASNREIAHQLCIAENTVRVHVHHILDKLKLRNRHQVYHFARREKISLPIQNVPIVGLEKLSET